MSALRTGPMLMSNESAEEVCRTGESWSGHVDQRVPASARSTTRRRNRSEERTCLSLRLWSTELCQTTNMYPSRRTTNRQ